MAHAIAWIVDMLLRLVVPAPGRHRAVARTVVTAPVADVPAVSPVRVPPPLRAEDVALFRPYRAAHEEREEREEAMRRWRCRRTLVLAVHGSGVDLGAYLLAEAGR